MVKGENNYNKMISVILGEVWSIVEAHRKGPQPFSEWSGIRKFTVPCVEPKEMSRSLIHSTGTYGIYYVPGVRYWE